MKPTFSTMWTGSMSLVTQYVTDSHTASLSICCTQKYVIMWHLKSGKYSSTGFVTFNFIQCDDAQQQGSLIQNGSHSQVAIKTTTMTTV